MNLIAGEVRSGVLHLAETAVTAVSTPDGPVTVGVRPEHLQLHAGYTEGCCQRGSTSSSRWAAMCW